LKKKTELRFIHQEIGLLRDENHHQNTEIALLKEKISSTKDSYDQRIMTAASPDDNHRNKRPVRLLPPHILFGERKNETELQKQTNRRRYEQPTNCSDLSLLGFTLNGFYLVKSNESSTSKSKRTNNDIKLETVFCAFKQPEGKFNPALVEKRIISRRETKPSSGKVLYFHATRKRDLKFNGFKPFGVTFDKVNVNLENAFDATKGTFTLPKSGVYLFVFRGLATFSQEKVGRQVVVYFNSNTRNLATHTIWDNNNKMINTELDKLYKGNRGDTISVEAYFNELGAKFSAGNSTSFAGFLLEE